MREWINKVNLSSFRLNLFQIRTCVISARKPKHIEVTAMSKYSLTRLLANQSARTTLVIL